MLDINGKEMAKASAKKSSKGDARLANIFMSPVKIDENFVYPKFEKTPEDEEFIVSAVSDNFIFADVEKEERKALLDAFEKHIAPKGTNIITEGEVGDYFYVIHEGSVEYVAQGERVGVGSKGHSFGEIALLYDCPRRVSVVAGTDCSLWRVDQKSFRQILANGRLDGDRDTIETLRKVSFLTDLSAEYLAKMAAAAKKQTYKSGDVIIKKGDPGNTFFILKDGSVVLKDIEAGGEIFADQVYKAGDFFGERAIVTEEPRAANVIAQEDCTTLCLSREDFLSTVGPLEVLMKKTNDFRVLKSIPYFTKSDVQKLEYEELVSRIEDVSFSTGSKIFEEGADSDLSIYLVRSGKISISSSKFPQKTRIVSTGGFFGVDSCVLLKETIATATVIEDCVVGKLPRSELKAVIRSITRLNQDPKKLAAIAKNSAKYAALQMKDLKKHRILGVGTFGKVWLVSSEANGRTEAFALKVQRKRQLIQHNQVEGVIREIKVMGTLDHPFILKLVNVFQDDQTIMMLLNLVQGGELYSVLKRHKNMMLPERDSKFYGSCILEGLHFMHYHSILYRDLKPENVLIDKDGYAVIVDLGFAKYVTGKTFTLCGTPWYIAPEVILGRGHGKACDYWSWAILIHEMCTGDTPFQDHGIDQMTLFKGIVKGKFKISDRASAEVEDMIRKILVTKPQYRLGNLAGGTKDIKTHAWLKDVDFNKLSKKVFRSPWKPEVKDPLDVEAFDNWDHMEREEKEPPMKKAEQTQFQIIDEISKR